jgi:C4-dicarboxylate-binding protein DctP
MPRAWVLPCLVVVVLLAGPLHETDRASPADRGKVVLRFSHNQPTTRIPHQAAVLFKQLVEERTQGYYDVQLFPAQQLGRCATRSSKRCSAPSK